MAAFSVKLPEFMKGQVQRGHWIYDRERQEFVAPEEYRRQSSPSGIQVMADIKPYKSVTGEIIGGRKQHRDFLRAHGLVEVGNEKMGPPKRKELSDARHDVKAAMDMVRSGYKPRPLDVWRDEG